MKLYKTGLKGSEGEILQPILSWDDLVWSDPDGGKIILHGTLPTVIFPLKMRPRESWHGIALLESPDVVDLWVQEEIDEAESPGVNLNYSLISGGGLAIYLDDVTELEGVVSGRFPDPEPRRLHRNAVRHERSVYFIEPTADDDEWYEYLSKEAKAASHWRKLLGMISLGGKWRKRMKNNVSKAREPPKGVTKNMASASVLALTWWQLSEWLINESISSSRDNRFAARLRGALADLRIQHGDDATLILPMHMPWRNAIYSALNEQKEVEEISSSPPDSDDTEEE